MPKIRRSDDIFLVSFPKSGNTWISFIIANIMVLKLELGIEVNDFNIHGFVPAIHQSQDIPSDMGFFPFKRIIKSHAGFHSGYKNVLYILRDPRSVMVSYYKFLTGLGRYDSSMSEFVREERYGVSAWVHHLEGWLKGISEGTRFRILKYEDFKSDIEGSINSMASLLGIRLSDEQLKIVVEKTSFEYMRELEKQSASLSLKKHDKNFMFVRKGSATAWKEELGPEDASYIASVAGPLMERFGYK